MSLTHLALGNFSFRTDTILLENEHLFVDINSLDIDENGMIDLCVNDFKSNRTLLFLQNENQKFSHDTLYDYQNSHVTNLSVVDFDSDKDLDILLCNVFDGTIVLLENRKHNVINYIEIVYTVYKFISKNLFFVLILFTFIIGFLFYKQNKISHYFMINNTLIESLQQKVNHQELINYRQGQAIQEIKNSNNLSLPTQGNLDHFLSELKELNPKIQSEFKKIPNKIKLINCVGGGSSAYGFWSEFIDYDKKQIELIGVEAGGPKNSKLHAAPLTNGAKLGILHGAAAYVCQNSEGQINDTASISAGLDYPGVSPIHCFLKDTKRARYTSATDEGALNAYKLVSKLEKINPSLEPCHAFAEAIRIAPKLSKDTIIIVNSCGDAKKDRDILKARLGKIN